VAVAQRAPWVVLLAAMSSSNSSSSSTAGAAAGARAGRDLALLGMGGHGLLTALRPSRSPRQPPRLQQQLPPWLPRQPAPRSRHPHPLQRRPLLACQQCCPCRHHSRYLSGAAPLHRPSQRRLSQPRSRWESVERPAAWRRAASRRQQRQQRLRQRLGTLRSPRRLFP
jgi:hypothetical protein